MALFDALDGKDTADYCQRVEVSALRTPASSLHLSLLPPTSYATHATSFIILYYTILFHIIYIFLCTIYIKPLATHEIPLL